MTTVITYDEITKGLVGYNDLRGALVGGWCRYPFIPDRCEKCRDENFRCLPATGYVLDHQGWRHGVCEQCRPGDAKTRQKVTYLERAVLLYMAVNKRTPSDERIKVWRDLLGVFADATRGG
jgi:hypothetical protein